MTLDASSRLDELQSNDPRSGGFDRRTGYADLWYEAAKNVTSLDWLRFEVRSIGRLAQVRTAREF